MDYESSSSSLDWEEELEAVATFVVLDEEYKSSKTREWVNTINKKRKTFDTISSTVILFASEIVEYSPLEYSWLSAGNGVGVYDC
ncbi:hypothetical protein ACI65C_010857 [Semiaphis heraclei]